MGSPDPRWLACYHEAGHCVAAWALGNHVAEVEIEGNGAGHCKQGPPIGLPQRIREQRFYVSTVAGGIAAARRFGPIGFRGTDGDYCLTRSLTAFDASERHALWQAAEGHIDRNWRAVCLIAHALYREGRLGRRRIIELLQPKRGGLARRDRAAA
jgi:hypothetical protein